MDTLARNAVVAGALLAGGAVFYHYVIYLPGLDQQKAQQVEVEKTASALAAEARREQYDQCEARARSNYEANWAAACKSMAEFNAAHLQNCLADRGNTLMSEGQCKQIWGQIDASPQCTLPKGRADGINRGQQEDHEKCLTEAKLGL